MNKESEEIENMDQKTKAQIDYLNLIASQVAKGNQVVKGIYRRGHASGYKVTDTGFEGYGKDYGYTCSAGDMSPKEVSMKLLQLAVSAILLDRRIYSVEVEKVSATNTRKV